MINLGCNIKNYVTISVVKITKLLEILLDQGKISTSIIDEVNDFLKENQCLNIISNEVLTTKPKV